MGDTVVTFRYGSTINPEEMAPGTIYLDGACRGPKIDVEKRSYSFDHHAECSRFATLSTCEQVLLALDLGLNPEGMEIVLNDLDADGAPDGLSPNDPVNSWLDKAGNGYDFTGKRGNPTYSTRNGRGVVNFDGDDSLWSAKTMHPNVPKFSMF